MRKYYIVWNEDKTSGIITDNRQSIRNDTVVQEIFINDTQSAVDNTQLIECIQNLMGCFDTPIARKLINNPISNEARDIGRRILNERGLSVLGIK